MFYEIYPLAILTRQTFNWKLTKFYIRSVCLNTSLPVIISLRTSVSNVYVDQSSIRSFKNETFFHKRPFILNIVVKYGGKRINNRQGILFTTDV